MFYRLMILTGMLLIICTSLLQAGTVTYDFSDPAQIQSWEQFSEACWNGVDAACGGNPPPFKHEWAVGDGVLNQSVNNVRTCDNGGPTGGDEFCGDYLVLRRNEFLDSQNGGSPEAWSDYTVSIDVKFDDDDILGVMWYFTDDTNYYRLRISQTASARNGVDKASGTMTVLTPKDPFPDLDGLEIEIGGDYVNVEISMDGPTMTISLDGEPYDVYNITDTDPRPQNGSVAVYMWSLVGAFDNLSITGDNVGIGAAVESRDKLAAIWGDIKSRQ